MGRNTYAATSPTDTFRSKMPPSVKSVPFTVSSHLPVMTIIILPAMMMMKKNDVDAIPSPVPATTKNALLTTKRNVPERRINVRGLNVRRHRHHHPSNHQPQHRKAVTRTITRTAYLKTTTMSRPATRYGFPMARNGTVLLFGPNVNRPVIAADLPLRAPAMVRTLSVYLNRTRTTAMMTTTSNNDASNATTTKLKV